MVMRFTTFAAAAFAAAMTVTPIAAEVTEQDEDGFVVRDAALVDATPKQVWLALITPATWWNKTHTWSGDPSNLSLRPQAGGCFCERIPEIDDGETFTLEGSVEHMRVVQSNPEAALRMVGALGPLQSEPVTGVLTIAISRAEKGTRIVWEYHVGGRMRYEVPQISKAVDGVISLQLNSLAQSLGRIDRPANLQGPEDGTAGGGAQEAPAEEPQNDPVESQAEQVDDGKSAVDDAFGDLASDETVLPR